MNRKSWTAGILIPFAAAMVVSTAPAASAKSVRTVASGRCSMGSHWTMKAKPDNGWMEVEMEVDSNRRGQRWATRIADNRVLIYKATRMTVGPSGSFEVRKLTANRAGRDHFVGVATNLRNHERCVARVNR